MNESPQLRSALICVSQGWWIFPLGECSKHPDNEFAPHGFKSASNDPQQITQWWVAKPSNNVGIDLGRSNLTVLDFDKGEPPAELNLPTTLQISTSRGTHVYFNGSSQQGNMYVDGTHVGEIKSSGGYTLAPFSQHPDGPIYSVKVSAPIVALPDGLVDSLRIAPNKEGQDDAPRNEAGMVPHGAIHNWALAQAGRLRNMGLDLITLTPALLKLVHDNCQAPIDDSKIYALAQSVCKSWPAGQSTDLVLTQAAAATPTAFVAESTELPDFADAVYPRFPSYVMKGTSIYEGMVKPVCDLNSRIDYFMWLSGMILLLNYIGPKIKIKTGMGPRPFKGSIYTVLIGRKGKTNKSSSVDDAMSYFHYCGCLAHANRDIKNSEGKILTFTAGSPEGLGLEMRRTNCSNAVLFYDELSQLVSKAGIESSSLSSALLTMYESKKFANSVKSGKETYSLDPDTYCTSLIACTTDKKFAELWSRLAGSDTGLDDRFFFIMQPEKLPEPRLQQYVNTVMGSIETKKRIDKALAQGEYEYEDINHPKTQELVKIENRYANRAEKWAVALAVDLGLDAIDSDCQERAADIVKYEIAVKEYLKSYEATTREGQIQQDIRRHLEMAKGRMPKRDLLRKMNYDRFGTSLWSMAFGGLIKHGVIREDGSGTRNDPAYIQLLIKRESDEND